MKLKIILSTILMFLVEALGGWTTNLKALLFLILTDYVIAFTIAVIEKDIDIQKHIKGICKKIGYLFLVAVSVSIGGVINQDFHNMVIYFLIVQETLSILRNLEWLGVPVPKMFKNQIEKMEAQTHDES